MKFISHGKKKVTWGIGADKIYLNVPQSQRHILTSAVSTCHRVLRRIDEAVREFLSIAVDAGRDDPKEANDCDTTTRRMAKRVGDEVGRIGTAKQTTTSRPLFLEVSRDDRRGRGLVGRVPLRGLVPPGNGAPRAPGAPHPRKGHPQYRRRRSHQSGDEDRVLRDRLEVAAGDRLLAAWRDRFISLGNVCPVDS